MPSIDIHIRIDSEGAQRIDQCAAVLSERARVKVSRSAAARALLDLGIRELLRERKSK